MQNEWKNTEEKVVEFGYYYNKNCRMEEIWLKPEDLNGIYKDFAENLGVEIAKLVFDNYKGLQVTFPVKFLSGEYIAEMISKEYDGTNIKELARKYDCSERKVRSVLKENRIGKQTASE